MPSSCTPATSLGLVKDLLASVDCNARGLTEFGYAALAQPNAPFSAILFSLLTLSIAFIGFGLLLGRTPLRIGELSLTALKIGIVLTLATNWPTYQTLIFNTLFSGPDQLAKSMLNGLQSPTALLRGDPYDGLQRAYDEMQAAISYLGRSSVSPLSPGQSGMAGAVFSLNVSSFLMLGFSLGIVLVSKLVLGILLALGPIFGAFLLFNSTRGLFEGWLRAALIFALAPLLAALSLAIHLVMLEPYLIRLSEMRAQGLLDSGAANAILLLTLISTGVALSLAIAVLIIAISLRIAAPQARPSRQPAPIQAHLVSEPQFAEVPHRVAAIAAAAADMERRDRPSYAARAQSAVQRLSVQRSTDSETQPLGQSYRRNVKPPQAASTLRRDK